MRIDLDAEDALNRHLAAVEPRIRRELRRWWLKVGRELTDEQVRAIMIDLDGASRVIVRREIDRFVRQNMAPKWRESGATGVQLTVRALRRAGIPAEEQTIEQWIEERTALMTDAWTRYQRDAWSQVQRRAAADEPVPSGRQIAALVRRAVGLTGQQARGLRRIWARLTGQAAAEKQIARVTGRAQQVYHRARGQRIARTELAAGFNAGIVQAAQLSGAIGGVEKIWRTQRDEMVCKVCGPLHGERQPIGVPFSIGRDAPPAHPHCRCVMDLGR